MRASLAMNPTKASQSMHAVHPAMGRQSSHGVMAAHVARTGPIVRYGDEWSEEGSGGGGTSATGKIARWNSDRGFGFIQPSDGGEDLFCHVTSLVDGEGSVDRNDFVQFY